MRIRSEKGFTGIDIAVSIVLVFIFSALIATLSFRISSTSKELEHRVDATYHAIDEIEKIKGWSFNDLIGKNANSTDITINNETIPINESGPGTQIGETGFYKKKLIKDYHDIDQTKTPDVVKKVTVIISYQFKGQTEEVKLSTIFVREN